MDERDKFNNIEKMNRDKLINDINKLLSELDSEDLIYLKEEIIDLMTEVI